MLLILIRVRPIIIPIICLFKGAKGRKRKKGFKLSVLCLLWPPPNCLHSSQVQRIFRSIVNPLWKFTSYLLEPANQYIFHL